MTHLRDKLIAEFSRIYWAQKRERPVVEELADKAIELLRGKK